MKKNDTPPFAHALIVDGRVNSEELGRMGYSAAWLDTLLSKNKISYDQIFLLTLSDDGTTNIILKEENK